MSVTELEPDSVRARDRAHGIWAPAVTPLERDLAIDEKRFAAHVAWLLEKGCHGVAVFGTTGEATSFSVDERMAALDAVLTAGVPADRLMVGTGCCALSDTLSLTRHALDAGCRRVLMLPPFYYKGMSDEGLFASYAEVIERLGRGDFEIYLYHFPRLSGVPITHGLIELLLKSYGEIVVGLKDSSGDPESLQAYLSAFSGLTVFPGTESLLLAGLKQGAAGCITASANVNAPAVRRVYDAWAAGDREVARLQEIIGAHRAALQSEPLIPTLKRLLAREHDDAAWLALRPPLTPTGASAAEKQDESLSAAGFAFAR